MPHLLTVSCLAPVPQPLAHMVNDCMELFALTLGGMVSGGHLLFQAPGLVSARSRSLQRLLLLVRRLLRLQGEQTGWRAQQRWEPGSHQGPCANARLCGPSQSA